MLIKVPRSTNPTLKVLHITPAFFPATYWGGPIHSVFALCNELSKIPNVSLRVATTDAAGPSKSDSVVADGVPMVYTGGYEVYFYRRLFGASVSPALLCNLYSMIRWADVLHLTGVYSFPTIPVLIASRLFGKPMVWSPRGALQRWDGTTKPLLKRAWERVCNSIINPAACVLHTTSDQESAESGLRINKARIAEIPNAVYVPHFLDDRVWRPNNKLRLLFIGRLHPKKGIENLLNALRQMKGNLFSLVVCGTGDSAYITKLHEMVTHLGLGEVVSFSGHLEGDAKYDAFMNADVCVVPSFTENFGMVVVESLAHGVPVIVSKGAPWSGVETYGCGLWVDNSVASLDAAINEIASRDLAAMGQRGWEWMKRDYSWATVATRMHSLYVSLLKG